MPAEENEVTEEVWQALWPIGIGQKPDSVAVGFLISPTVSKTDTGPKYFGFITEELAVDESPRNINRRLVTAIKRAAGMNLDIRDQPQVGYIRLTRLAIETVFVVQTRPTRFGEEVTVRRLPENDVSIPFQA